MSRVVSILCAAAVILVSSWARGDAVPPPPTDCAEGTTGHSDHNCKYCSPKTCSSQSACAAGTACQAVQLCVETVNCVNQMGGWTASNYTASCPGSCAGKCETVNVCMPEAGGCAFAIAAPTAVGGFVVLLLLVIVLRVRRRR